LKSNPTTLERNIMEERMAHSIATQLAYDRRVVKAEDTDD